MQLLREVKEKCCLVMQSPGGPDEEVKTNKGNIETLKKGVRHALPDGTEIVMSEEKYLAPEILFSPERAGYDFVGVHEMLFSSIAKADVDLRATLYGSICVSGAGSKFVGFASRVLNEVVNKGLENVPVLVECSGR
eukprot:TRINITY_DN5274_c0_g1_i14.p3 TRINITY_DN5274_c0_g1~~TRINITY_DN5274_c0_g1_i14.p3  ORF type:complete len:136 (-),score=31.66 TRINITY_DN5274_c0_g1_i14:261-668(-)